MITKTHLVAGLKDLGIKEDMELEVHSSLSSFGFVEGGALTVIESLKEVVGLKGSIFMPALRLSPDLPLTEMDKRLGILRKIKILPPDNTRSAMGIIADTFRTLPDVYTGEGIFRISAWGKHAKKAENGLDYMIHNGGKALLLGVDIYRLTAMHYVEDLLPEKVRNIFKPSDEVDKIYPPVEWFIEMGEPPVKPWYTIQDKAYEKGVIKTGVIGDCKCMFFDIWDVVGIYEKELKDNPYRLYGIE
jgi:aminoglycoside N3'-acetyltransferase